MALQKKKELNTGITVSYWRIVTINTTIGAKTEVLIGGFLDKNTSDAGKRPVETVVMIFEINKDKYIVGNVIATAYNQIKQSIKKIDDEGNEIETNFFFDAIDV